ncbi:uncharacterized protein MONOS_472 [Monocercomonoides exilis]|uniref:uncharacterized protein n=1 Tax=Monocercomonoides exilis TaxID=2049356 RepID=UPI003559EFE9|nr:hypothetical protein MONOS_472 [Monocercomonoides exilis]|eukprot:MONOS_472.1-p1 / transcript=MONOS_472.1 / gene=MONOS_472 / organism=Monocercomonoides_exilis_PA203 / gene_product=unspecified product / transcript_product=unspecified product / location=Mono_scaffold00007:218189-220606(+) / protein_length=806 / sequence_SO=supercontig / SO=protein_coding / is_pseudo=false
MEANCLKVFSTSTLSDSEIHPSSPETLTGSRGAHRLNNFGKAEQQIYCSSYCPSVQQSKLSSLPFELKETSLSVAHGAADRFAQSWNKNTLYTDDGTFLEKDQILNFSMKLKQLEPNKKEDIRESDDSKVSGNWGIQNSKLIMHFSSPKISNICGIGTKNEERFITQEKEGSTDWQNLLKRNVFGPERSVAPFGFVSDLSKRLLVREEQQGKTIWKSRNEQGGMSEERKSDEASLSLHSLSTSSISSSCESPEALAGDVIKWRPSLTLQSEVSGDVVVEVGGEKCTDLLNLRMDELKEKWQHEDSIAVGAQYADRNCSLAESFGASGTNDDDNLFLEEQMSRRRIVKAQIKEAIQFRKIFGVWVEKEWNNNEEERQMWEAAKRRSEKSVGEKEEQEQFSDQTIEELRTLLREKEEETEANGKDTVQKERNEIEEGGCKETNIKERKEFDSVGIQELKQLIEKKEEKMKKEEIEKSLTAAGRFFMSVKREYEKLQKKGQCCSGLEFDPKKMKVVQNTEKKARYTLIKANSDDFKEISVFQDHHLQLDAPIDVSPYSFPDTKCEEATAERLGSSLTACCVEGVSPLLQSKNLICSEQYPTRQVVRGNMIRLTHPSGLFSSRNIFGNSGLIKTTKFYSKNEETKMGKELQANERKECSNFNENICSFLSHPFKDRLYLEMFTEPEYCCSKSKPLFNEPSKQITFDDFECVPCILSLCYYYKIFKSDSSFDLAGDDKYLLYERTTRNMINELRFQYLKTRELMEERKYKKTPPQRKFTWSFDVWIPALKRQRRGKKGKSKTKLEALEDS